VTDFDNVVGPVALDRATGTILLSTPETAYVLRLTAAGVRQVYWGRSLSLAQAASLAGADGADGADGVGDELPTEGGERFGPPSLHVAFHDGTEAIEWRAIGHDIDGGHLVVRLADRH
jgi:alpha-galactosidase